jgi:hypothetical protein
MPKGTNGQKRRSSCPAGCKAAEPMQSIIPINLLADAGASGPWLRLIAIRGWYDGMHSGWSAVHA